MIERGQCGSDSHIEVNSVVKSTTQSLSGAFRKVIDSTDADRVSDDSNQPTPHWVEIIANLVEQILHRLTCCSSELVNRVADAVASYGVLVDFVLVCLADGDSVVLAQAR